MFLGCDAGSFSSDCQNLHPSIPELSSRVFWPPKDLACMGQSLLRNSFKKEERACLISGNTEALGQR